MSITWSALLRRVRVVVPCGDHPDGHRVDAFKLDSGWLVSRLCMKSPHRQANPSEAGWVITHPGSGRRMPYVEFPTAAAAARCARAVAAVLPADVRYPITDEQKAATAAALYPWIDDDDDDYDRWLS